MKGYKNNLHEFINYVLKMYSKDGKVREFAEIYRKQEQTREQRRCKSNSSQGTKYVRISLGTADVCKKLVDCEVQREKTLGLYDASFKTKLFTAYQELKDYTYDSLSRLLEAMRDNG